MTDRPTEAPAATEGDLDTPPEAPESPVEAPQVPEQVEVNPTPPEAPEAPEGPSLEERLSALEERFNGDRNEG